MKSVFILYECDAWHSNSSMTAANIVGIATTEKILHSLLRERLINGYNDDIEKLVNNGDFCSMDDFVNYTIKNFKDNCNQTHGLSKYIDVEFNTDEITLNTLVL